MRNFRIEAEKSAGSDGHLECRQFGKLLDVVLVELGAFLNLGRIYRPVFHDKNIDLGRTTLLGSEIVDGNFDSGMCLQVLSVKPWACQKL